MMAWEHTGVHSSATVAVAAGSRSVLIGCLQGITTSVRQAHPYGQLCPGREVHVHLVRHVGGRGRQNKFSSVKTVGTTQSAVQSRTTARTTTAHSSLPTSSTLLLAWLDKEEEIIDAAMCAVTLQLPLQRLRLFLLAEAGRRIISACR